MTKKHSKLITVKKSFKKWFQKSITNKIIAIIIVTIVLTSIVWFIGGLITTITPVAQGQIESQITGLKIGRYSEGETTTAFDYIDRSKITSSYKTTSYSTWRPDTWLNSYGTAFLGSTKWAIDPDGAYSGAPDIEITRQATSTACDEYGNTIEEFNVRDRIFSFYDPDGNEIEYTYLWTDYTSSYTINVHGQADGNILQKSSVNYLDDWESESRGNYKERDSDQWKSLGGKGLSGTIVIQESLRNFEMGELSDIPPNYWEHNAFLAAEIVTFELVLTEADLTGSTVFGANTYESKITIPQQTGDISLFAHCQDALIGSSQMNRESVETIEVTDNWIDTVYWAIPLEKILLGTSYDQKGLFGWSCKPFEISSLQINVKTRFRVITSFGVPILPPNPDTTPTDPYTPDTDNGGGDDDTSFSIQDWIMQWLATLFKNPSQMDFFQWMITVGITLLILVVVIALFPQIVSGLIWLGRFIGKTIKRTFRAIRRSKR